MSEIHYENGNINSPVIVLGDDPSNEDNVLVTRLPSAVSVAKATITQEEGTPESAVSENQSELDKLKAKVAQLEGKGNGGN